MSATSGKNLALGIAGVSFWFRRDETIWTESCHKCGPHEVAEVAGRSGFECAARWVDDEWPFAVSLLLAV